MHSRWLSSADWPLATNHSRRPGPVPAGGGAVEHRSSRAVDCTGVDITQAGGGAVVAALVDVHSRRPGPVPASAECTRPDPAWAIAAGHRTAVWVAGHQSAGRQRQGRPGRYVAPLTLLLCCFGWNTALQLVGAAGQQTYVTRARHRLTREDHHRPQGENGEENYPHGGQNQQILNCCPFMAK